MAEALVSQFPSNELDVPATKDFVRAECIALKSEVMHREFRLQLIATLTFVGALLTAFRLL